VCQHCGAIESVPPDAVAALVEATAAANGFTLEPGHFALEGTCASCAP
jgi:Fur family ferric uptake transcriptional regulator